MTSRRMQILMLALFAASAVPTLAAEAQSAASQTPAPATSAGPRARSEWRRFEPELPRQTLTNPTPSPRKQTVTVETWVIIVAAVVLIILLV